MMLRNATATLVFLTTTAVVAPGADACQPPAARPTASGIFPRTRAPLGPDLQVLVSIEGEGTPAVDFLECADVCVPVEEPALNLVEVIPSPGLFRSLAVYAPDRVLADGDYIVEANGGGEPYIEGIGLQIDNSVEREPFKGDFSFDYDVVTFQETNGGSCLGSVEGAVQFTIRPSSDADIAWYDVRLLKEDVEVERLAIATGVEPSDDLGVLERAHTAPRLPDCSSITPHDVYGRTANPVTVCGARLCGEALEANVDGRAFVGLGSCEAPPRVAPAQDVPAANPPANDQPDEGTDHTHDLDLFMDGRDSGCGCSTGADPAPRLTAGVLLMLVVLLMRRRRA